MTVFQIADVWLFMTVNKKVVYTMHEILIIIIIIIIILLCDSSHYEDCEMFSVLYIRKYCVC
jgi:hypothetical protein